MLIIPKAHSWMNAGRMEHGEVTSVWNLFCLEFWHKALWRVSLSQSRSRVSQIMSKYLGRVRKWSTRVSEEDASFRWKSKGKGPEAGMNFGDWEDRQRPL